MRPRRTPSRRAALPAVVALALAPVLAGCSGDETGAPSDTAGVTDADVRFARQSLTQHAETLLLVDEAARKGVSPDVAAGLEEVRAHRTAEVEALTDLLEDWDEPVPATARDHANSGHGQAAEGHDDLAGEQGAEFEEAWLDLMTDRHEDALDLAETEVEEGRDAAAVRLARDMVTDLTEQVSALERLEDRTGG